MHRRWIPICLLCCSLVTGVSSEAADPDRVDRDSIGLPEAPSLQTKSGRTEAEQDPAIGIVLPRSPEMTGLQSRYSGELAVLKTQVSQTRHRDKRDRLEWAIASLKEEWQLAEVELMLGEARARGEQERLRELERIRRILEAKRASAE